MAQLFPFFGPCDSWYGILVHVEKLLAVFRQVHSLARGVLVNVQLLHAAPQWGEVSCLFETFDGRLPAAGQIDVPAGEGADHEGYDAGYDTEQDVVDGHESLDVGCVVHDFDPDPRAGAEEAEETKDCEVDEEKKKGLVVAEADAGG